MFDESIVIVTLSKRIRFLNERQPAGGQASKGDLKILPAPL